MKILFPEFFVPPGKGYLLERGYEVCERKITTKEALIEEIEEFDGLLIRNLRCDKDVIQAGKNLKVVSKYGIGVDNIDVECCTQRGVQVTFAPMALCESVAEHALFLIFACAKNAAYTVRNFMIGGDFEARNHVSGIELGGKTVGILGLGRIGLALAKMCDAMGMRVIGYDPYITQDNLDSYIRLASRDEVIKNADFLSMNLPCNDETRGAFGEREFALMKRTAYFINVSRGGVVRESDLIDALRNNVIRGGGIDVFEKEPTSLENQLLHMQNVYVTPHQAGSTEEALAKVSLHTAMGLDEVLSGKTVSWPVNKL